MAEAFTREEFVGFVAERELGVVATVNRIGAPEAAVVHIAVLADGEIIINSHVGSRKFVNLRAQPAIALVIGWEPVSYQVEGIARVVAGSERAQYAERYEQRFTDAHLGDDIDIAVIRPTWVRKVDARAYPAVMAEADWL